jgi:hypothetical protein
VVTGLVFVALGVLFNYLLEKVSFDSTESITYKMLAVFLPVLFVGIILCLVGCIAFAIQLGARQCALAGGLCLIASGILAGLAQLELLPINVHDWSGALLLPLFCLPLVGAFFLIAGAIKFLRSERRA